MFSLLSPAPPAPTKRHGPSDPRQNVVDRATGAGQIRSERPCNLCSGDQVSVLAVRGRDGRPLRTVLCQACGLVFSDPFPHDPRDFYQAQYRQDYKRTYVPRPVHVYRNGKVALRRLAKVQGWLSTPSQVLDVGSGGGEFAYLLQSRGHQVTGVEPCQGYAEYARTQFGIEVLRTYVQDLTLDADRWDLITLWHVLEHLADPLETLRVLSRSLRVRGVLFIEVPNVEGVCQAPGTLFHEAHLYNFSPATLSALVRQAGLLPLQVTTSRDGGKIMLAAQRPAEGEPVGPADFPLVGNAQRIAKIVQSHTRIGHLCTHHPYVRLVRRTTQALQERLGVRGFSSGRALLDQLYRA